MSDADEGDERAVRHYFTRRSSYVTPTMSREDAADIYADALEKRCYGQRFAGIQRHAHQRSARPIIPSITTL